MKLTFYKTRSDWQDILIKWFTHSKYCMLNYELPKPLYLETCVILIKKHLKMNLNKHTNKLSQPIASHSNDPANYNALDWFPNPDDTLTKSDSRKEIFHAIENDSHVTGELRTIRSALALFGYEHQLIATDDSKQAIKIVEQLTAWIRSSDINWHQALILLRLLTHH